MRPGLCGTIPSHVELLTLPSRPHLRVVAVKERPIHDFKGRTTSKSLEIAGSGNRTVA
jgi:hypothetical protein